MNYAGEDGLDALMDDLQVIYTMRAGQTVTQEDVNALQRLDDHWRKDAELAADVYHRGFQDGLRVGGGASVQELQNKLDSQWSELSTEKALRRMERHWSHRAGAQAMREMLARFVEQGGDHTTAASIRANWNPAWGDDPGAPKDEPAAA